MRAGAPQGVKIIAVFDGESSKDKSLEDAERRKRRQKAQVGIEVQRTTPDVEKQSPEWLAEYARLCRAAVSIDWEVKLACITLLHQCGIEFILAPHEADHQLSKLCVEKLADGVIADDFDMLTHGVPKMIGKYKHGSSEGVLYDMTVLTTWSAKKHVERTWLLDAAHTWGPQAFLMTSCLWKSDYSRDLKGMGAERVRQVLEICKKEHLGSSPSDLAKAQLQWESETNEGAKKVKSYGPAPEEWELVKIFHKIQMAFR